MVNKFFFLLPLWIKGNEKKLVIGTIDKIKSFEKKYFQQKIF